MQSAKSIDARRKLQNSRFDLALRAIVVWTVMAWCIFTVVTAVTTHKIFWFPPAWILFPVAISAGGLQEKRWHNTIGYPIIVVATLLALAFGIYAN